MFGISRGPDTRPPEVKAADEKIVIGYMAVDGGLTVFSCTECKQTSMLEVKHLPECSVGKILDAYTSRLK